MQATAASAGLAIAGIAAGAMLLRKYFLTDAPMRRKEQPRDRTEPDAEGKKELRRKRPVGGYARKQTLSVTDSQLCRCQHLITDSSHH